MIYIDTAAPVNSDIGPIALPASLAEILQPRLPAPATPERAVNQARALLKLAKKQYTRRLRQPYADERGLRRKLHGISDALAVLRVIRRRSLAL